MREDTRAEVKDEVEVEPKRKFEVRRSKLEDRLRLRFRFRRTK